MLLCTLFPLCAILSHSEPVPPNSTRRSAGPFGEQRKFLAGSLPRAIEFRASGPTRNAAPIASSVDKDTPTHNGGAHVVHEAATGPSSDIGPYLRARSPLADSDHLVNRAAFDSLIASVRLPLKTENDARTTERNGMLPEADSIDTLANDHLGPWKERLDVNLAKLDKETESYKTEADIHHSRCAPARDEATWKWCLEDKKRLDLWLDKLTQNGDAHNAELEKFHTESRPYDARLAVLIAKIESWERAVNDLIGRIKEALGKNIGTCTAEEFDRLDDAITELCKRAKWVCVEEQTCTVLLANLNAGKKCFDARKAMMDQCFGGGDPTHDRVLRETQNGIDRCRRIHRTKCEGAGVKGGGQ